MHLPEERTVLDVRTTTRPDVMTAWVTTVTADELIVTVGQDASGRRVRLDVGERMQLVWRGAEVMQEMPVVLLATEQTDDGVAAWRLRPVGTPSRLQRRDAVRASLELPLVLEADPVRVSGTTVDLSEGGLRCRLQLSSAGAGHLAQVAAAGEVLQASIDLGAQHVSAQARFVRDHHGSGGVADFSLGFVDLPDKVADQIRARVFAALREERARRLD